MGDLNAHHAAWFATSSSGRGDDIIETIENSALCVLNTDTPTRLPSHGNANSPDVTLILAHLALSALWSTNINLNSDHLPITVDLGGDSAPARSAKTFTNFRLADWGGFLEETEFNFAVLPEPASCTAGERVFHEIVNAASGHWIPSGHRKSYTPGLPRVAVPLMNRRDELRHADPQDPEVANLNDEINDVICESFRQAWTEKVESCGPNSNSSKYWSLIRNLSRK
jgi:hypothetical protein